MFRFFRSRQAICFRYTVMDPDMEEAIKRDQLEHPGCNYSTSMSSMTSWANGEHKAETLRSIIRNCQGQVSGPLRIKQLTESVTCIIQLGLLRFWVEHAHSCTMLVHLKSFAFEKVMLPRDFFLPLIIRRPDCLR